jgi:cell division protein FtsI/penicillin-binding protein 2
VVSAFLIRAFYLQIIRHDHYQTAALQGQFKEYEVPASRGVIDAHDGNKIIPIVLNEKKYTLFADPKYIKDARKAADEVARVIGGKAQEYEEAMKRETRYAILAKKLSKEQREKLDDLEIKGLGTREQEYRTYPQGELAAQLLGFVNDEGKGTYGIEQALNEELSGQAGQLKAITDAQGVPLVSNKDNVVTEPEAGKRVVLTIDMGMQRQLETLLKQGLDAAQSKSGGALIMDPYTGAIKAMANYPTFNPAEFFKIEDATVFNNALVSSDLEPGSIMKPLTVAAALNTNSVGKDQTYYDPAQWKIDNETIRNVEEDGGAAQRSVTDILIKSLNTGASWLLMQMGGGEINEKARTTWHDYLSNHYRLGRATGIEQGYESAGIIPDPHDGDGLNIRFANSSFGQGMSATPLQMVTALASVVNGGTYYRPHLVDKTINADGTEKIKKPEVIRTNVVSEDVSATVRKMMEAVVPYNNRGALRTGYSVGGKTGTAEIANPDGGYFVDKYNGTYMGFVGGNKPQYVIIVRVNEPKIPGYAGSKAAAPIFATLANMLMDNFNVLPKS